MFRNRFAAVKADTKHQPTDIPITTHEGFVDQVDLDLETCNDHRGHKKKRNDRKRQLKDDVMRMVRKKSKFDDGVSITHEIKKEDELISGTEDLFASEGIETGNTEQFEAIRRERC